MKNCVPPNKSSKYFGGVATFIAAACFCSTTGWAQDQQDIDQQIQQLEAAKQLTDQIEQELRNAAQQIEDEQRALLDRLGRTHDELQQERHRNRELQRQLDGLLGGSPDSPVPPESHAAASAPLDPRWVPKIDRQINPLGLIESTRTDLAEVAPGVNGVTLKLPVVLDLENPGAAVHLVAAGNRVTLEHAFPAGDALKLATLTAQDGRLTWDWHAFSPARVHDVLPRLDQQLRFAVIETQIDGVTVGRYQFEPEMIRLPGHIGTPPIPFAISTPASINLHLTRAAAGPGWALLENTATTVAWGANEMTVSINYRDDSLVATRGPGITAKLEEIKQQRKLWEADLRQANSANPPSIDTQRAAEHIEALAEAQTQLTRALETIGDAPATTRTLSVELVGYDPKITVYRVELDQAE